MNGVVSWLGLCLWLLCLPLFILAAGVRWLRAKVAACCCRGDGTPPPRRRIGAKEFPPAGDLWAAEATPELLNCLTTIPAHASGRFDSVKEIKHFTEGQSGAIVAGFTLNLRGGGEFTLVSKTVRPLPGEGGDTREAEFYRSELWEQTYLAAARGRGAHPLGIYYVDIDPTTGASTMLMEMGGVHFPGKPGDPLPEGSATEATVASVQAEWLPDVAEELAAFHGTFWKSSEMLPISWTSFWCRFVCCRPLLLKSGAVLGKDPYPLQASALPILTALGKLDLFRGLCVSFFGIPCCCSSACRLWARLPMRAWLLAPLPRGGVKAGVAQQASTDKFNLLAQIGDHIARRPTGPPSRLFTLVHNDFKYENVLIKYVVNETGERAKAVQIYDMELAGVGPPAKDLAVLVITSLGGDAQDQLEATALDRYCRTLWSHIGPAGGQAEFRGGFDEFAAECRRCYFETSMTTILTMNALVAQNKKTFHKLPDRTLAWFLRHRTYFELTEPLVTQLRTHVSRSDDASAANGVEGGYVYGAVQQPSK